MTLTLGATTIQYFVVYQKNNNINYIVFCYYKLIRSILVGIFLFLVALFFDDNGTC